MKWNSVLLATLVVSGMFVAGAQSESRLMSYEDYMERCTETYGSDRVSTSVCENQYLTMYAKEEELTAQADTRMPEAVTPEDEVSSPSISEPETEQPE
ncbi:hypothetical protein KDD30_19340 (plasmid) [Photobacterium sp. GJ3]|uniref:hypothetical protein n=1 Tax=Photobacterium sp. GJ3 TaxID=2829502 RepID=UPI001B8BDAD9|nr:hypothetical protein [Photobacterium sp. GJ3]QUJ70276.1 hypothetical protein KDD30_19340 [Photobacterium sp. GJ3]